TANTKYVQALGAVRDVLQKLPAGTSVSLWIFGQFEPTATEAKDADRTVKRILEPTVWRPNDTVQLAQLMAKLEYPTVRCWNETPVLRAMIAAKRDLADAQGFRTLLVITDGMDNRWREDAELNPLRRDLAIGLRENFQNAGILIQMVGFKFAGQE